MELSRLEKYQLSLILYDGITDPITKASRYKRKKRKKHVSKLGGMGPTEIAEHLDMSAVTVNRWVREWKIKPSEYDRKNVDKAFTEIKRAHTRTHLDFLVQEKIMSLYGEKANSLIAELFGLNTKEVSDRRRKGYKERGLARKLVMQDIVDKEYEKKLTELKKIHTKKTMHFFLIDKFYKAQGKVSRKAGIGQNTLEHFLGHVGLETNKEYIAHLIITAKKLRKTRKGRIETRKPFWYHKKLIDDSVIDEYAKKIEDLIVDMGKEYFICTEIKKVPEMTMARLHRFFKNCPDTKEVPYPTVQQWFSGKHAPSIANHFSHLDQINLIVGKTLLRLNLEDSLNHRSWIWPIGRMKPNLDFLYGVLIPKLREVFSKKEVEKVLRDSPMFKQGIGGNWYSRLRPIAVKEMDKQEYKELTNKNKKEVYKHRQKYRV